MNVLTTVVVLLLSTLVSASGQSSIVGKWESDMENEFSDELYVWEFRQDGILLQNEYYEGDLECVYAFQYTVSGDEVTIGDGLNWEYDVETGEFELYEDFADENVDVTLTFVADGGELVLSFSNESLLQGIVEDMRADEDIELDPADLGLDYDFADEDLVISDEELTDVLQKIFVFSLGAFFEADTGEELNLDPEGDLEDILNTLVIALFTVQLEEILEVEIDDLETELDGDADEVITAVFEELGILRSDVDDPTQEELRNSIQELDQIGEIVAAFETEAGFGLPAFEFVSSQHEILTPGSFVLPSGRTAVEDKSWGQIKRRLSR